MKEQIGFIVTAGHLDIEWYQPLRSYRFWTIQTFEDLKTAARREDFTTYVLDGQVYPLEQYLKAVPEDEDEMRRLIREKKLAVGPFYTQFDEWLPSAESIVRNCLYGRRRADQFGETMLAGYLPDNFGHPRQLPQILRQFGIDSLLFMRGFPEVPGGHPDEFLYEGLDGSRVLCSHFRESYSGAFDIFSKKVDPIQPRETPYYPHYLSFEWHRELARHDDPQQTARTMIERARNIADRYPSGVIPLIAGADHLPPQINVGDTVRHANAMNAGIRFVMGSAQEYVRLVNERLREPAVYGMELLGSRYQYILMGALSTRTYLKTQNFACEALMERYAEPLAAIASLYGHPFRRTLMDEAWENLMINSAHDSIHGSSVDEVHDEMDARFAAVRQIASGVAHASLAHLGARMKPWWTPEAKGVLVWTPAACAAPQPMEVWLPLEDDRVTMVARDGRPLPTQVLAREPIEQNGIGLARNAEFPSLPFRKVLFLDAPQPFAVTSYATAPQAAPPQTALLSGDGFMENEYLRVEADGALIHLYDKLQARWYRDLNLLEEEADAGDAWDFSPPWTPGEVVRSTQARFSCALAERGPVRAVMTLSGSLSVPACLEGDKRSARRTELPVRFTVTLYAGVARVEVCLEIENTAKDHRVRLRLCPRIETDCVRSQGHFAILDRPVRRGQTAEPWRQPVTQLLPFREWLAVQDQAAGLAVAVKGLYDYEAVMNPLTNQPELALTLLRGVQKMGRLNMMQRMGSASMAIDTPGAQCPGPQRFEWAYLPYGAGEDEKAPHLPVTHGFLYPPVTHAVRGEPLAQGDESGWPGIGWNAPNLQFSALKRSEDGKSVVLRVYENQGKPCTLSLNVGPFAQARLSNMNEDPLEALTVEHGTLSLDVGAYQAVTVLLS